MRQRHERELHSGGLHNRSRGASHTKLQAERTWIEPGKEQALG